MLEDEAKTEGQISDAERTALESLKDAAANRESVRNAKVIDQMTEALNAASERETPAMRQVKEATELVAPAPARRYAGSGGRTQPTQIADYRYRTLPKWQQEFRNPADDLIVARYFRAIGTNDHFEVHRGLGQDLDRERIRRADNVGRFG